MVILYNHDKVLPIGLFSTFSGLFAFRAGGCRKGVEMMETLTLVTTYVIRTWKKCSFFFSTTSHTASIDGERLSQMKEGAGSGVEQLQYSKSRRIITAHLAMAQASPGKTPALDLQACASDTT